MLHTEAGDGGVGDGGVRIRCLHRSLVSRVAVREAKAVLAVGGVLPDGEDCGRDFLNWIMVSDASHTGSAWCESIKEVGSGLFSLHTK